MNGIVLNVKACWLTLGLDEKIALRHHVLAKLLHCVELFSSLSSNHVDFAKRSPADNFDQLEIVKGDFFVGPK